MVAVEFFGRDRGLSQAVKQQATAAGELDESYRDAARAARRLETDARKAFESTRTPLEQYNRGLARQKELLQSGAIDQDTYNRKVRELKDDYEETGQAGQEAFDVTNIAAFAGQLGIIAGVGETIRNIFSGIADERERAFQQAEQTAGLGGLRQLAETQEEFTDLLSRTARVSAAGVGAPGEFDQAANLVFALESAGAKSEEAFFSRLAATETLADVPGVIRAAQEVRKSFGDELARVPLEDIVSQAVATSPFTGVDVTSVLRQAARAAPAASAQGIDVAELFGTIATGSAAFGQAGGERIDAFLRSAARQDEFAGLNTEQIVEAINRQGLTSGELQKFLGDSTAVAGFRVLGGNIAATRAATAAAAVADEEQLARQRLAFTDATLEGVLATRQAENIAAIQTRGADAAVTLDASARNILRAETEADVTGSGVVDSVGRQVARIISAPFDFFGLDPGGQVAQIVEGLESNGNAFGDVAAELKEQNTQRFRERRQKVSTPQ